MTTRVGGWPDVAARPVAIGTGAVGDNWVPLGLGTGITASASFTPSAASYTAGNIIDTAKEFAFTLADGSAVPVGSLIRILTAIIKIDATALQASEGGYSLQCYSVTPPSARTNNSAWTLGKSGDATATTAELAAYRGTISLGTPVDMGQALYVKSPNIDLDIKLSGVSMFAELTNAATFTPTAVARQILLYGTLI